MSAQEVQVDACAFSRSVLTMYGYSPHARKKSSERRGFRSIRVQVHTADCSARGKANHYHTRKVLMSAG